MSDLQLSLLGLGAVLVVGVWVYNKLQERKYRQAAEKVFRGEQADLLASEAGKPVQDDVAADDVESSAYVETPERQEPQWREPTFSEERVEPMLEADPEPQLQSHTAPVASVPAVPVTHTADQPSAPPADWCDDSIDLIAQLHFQNGIAADDLRQAQAAMQGHQRVPLRAFVELSPSQWRPLSEVSDVTLTHAWFALQLVDRRGAVSTNDFEVLRHALQALVSLRDGTLLFPDVVAIGEQAKALDDFCAQLDLQLALNVLDAGNGAFAGTKIRGMAEAAGMSLAANGEFQAHDDNGNFMFAMANMGEAFDAQTIRDLQTHGLTFFLDVPHVKNGGHAFERMLSSARQFTNTLNASLVNAQRAPVSDVMVDSIRRKIFEIHEQMNIAGIPAGGVRALRLFS